MHVCFELSGEHETLPRSEVLASLRAESIPHRVVLDHPRLLCVEVSEGADLKVVAERLSLTHGIHQLITVCKPHASEMLDAAGRVLCDYISRGETYRVRVGSLGHTPFSKSLRFQLEVKTGEILHRAGFKANLEAPDVAFKLLITREAAVLTKTLHTVNRSSYEERKPQNKPFFHPGVLMPRISRALVNLCETVRGDVFLDPFCGTGGILVEAGMLGARVIGSDVQRRILLGARMNLEYYLDDFTLLYQNAAQLGLEDESVDAVVTDPPYGRSARIKRGGRLMEDSLSEMHRVLKTGRRAAIVYREPLHTLIADAGFSVLEYHVQRVHKSLTRHIYVMKK
jgi:tRNA (guanine10-N2)-dimethyltransferase